MHFYSRVLLANLAAACETLTPIKTDDFIDIGTLLTYANGTTAKVYGIPAGTQKIYFSEQYPEAYIDNIGFQTVGEAKAKGLYISITPGSERNAERLAASELAFKNVITGDVIRSDYMDIKMTAENADFSMNDGRIILTLESRLDRYYGEIRDLTESDLANYIIVGNPTEEALTRESGVWSFDFNVGVLAESKVFAISKTVELDGEAMTVDSITISPLNLLIRGSAEDMSGEKPSVNNTYLVMKDGSKLLASKKGAGGQFGTTIDLQYALDKPVNVENIQSIEFMGHEFPLR